MTTSMNSENFPLLREIRELLKDNNASDRAIIGYRSVDSTNRVARQWIRDGAREGSIVLAEGQTAGKGRLGRRWDAKPGRNLLFSIILRPDLSADRWGLITLAASVAVARTIEDLTSPYQPAIKWPNDIILDGRKCCGMLLETIASPEAVSTSDSGVVLGIGLNVNQISFPPALEEQAISLRLVTGRLIERAPLFVQLLTSIDERYEQLMADDGKSIRAAFTDRMLFTNERVTLRYTDENSSVEGLVEGIDETGGLRLRVDGRSRTFHAGDVTFRDSGVCGNVGT